MTEEDFPCPQCGKTVSKTDRYCKNCGASLIGLPEPLPTTPPPQEVMEPSYERRFSLLGRFYKLLTAPSEAMKDIALAPDYAGFFVIVALQVPMTAVTIMMALQKIQFVGTYAGQISSLLVSLLAGVLVLAVVLVIIRWLVKSLIVRYAGDSGRSWSFRTAASVTGYAYIISVIFAIVGIPISWFLVPTFIVDTTNLSTAIQQMNDYRAQLNTLTLTFSLPVSLIGLIWKSYLGGLGTHFGTNGKCSIRTGFVVFFALGLIGLLVSFVTSL